MTEVLISIDSDGWSVEHQRDETQPWLRVGVMLLVKPCTGREHTKIFHTPEDLWAFLRGLTTAYEETLKTEFGYVGPAKPKQIDLSDLEIEL